jgi:hypothetical protein
MQQPEASIIKDRRSVFMNQLTTRYNEPVTNNKENGFYKPYISFRPCNFHKTFYINQSPQTGNKIIKRLYPQDDTK